MDKYFKYIGETDKVLINGKIYRGNTNPYNSSVIVHTSVLSSSIRPYKLFEFMPESAEKDYKIQTLKEDLEEAKIELAGAEMKIIAITKNIKKLESDTDEK